MKYILHGENQALSRSQLRELVASQKNVQFFNQKSSFEQIFNFLESKSLFGEIPIFVFENFFSRTKSKEKEKIIIFLKSKTDLNVIFWESKKIDGRSLASFKDYQIKEFPLPWSIYKFLDSLNPKNPKLGLMFLHEALKKSPPELILFMLGKHLGDLIISADLGEKGLEAKAPWQKAKLVAQAKLFGVERLKVLYRNLLEIEYNLKSGLSSLPLSSSLDLWLANF